MLNIALSIKNFSGNTFRSSAMEGTNSRSWNWGVPFFWATLFILFFTCKINAGSMEFFSVFNREHEVITDAEISVNNKPAIYKPGYGYGIDSTLKSPYHVIMKHKGYLTVEYSNLTGFGQLYLIREGEDYYYIAPGIKVPIVRHRDLLYVVVASYKDGRPLPFDTALIKFQELLAANGMKISYNYHDSLQKLQIKSPEGGIWSGNLEHSFLVSKNDETEFAGECVELKVLRENAAIAEAGPALLQTDNPINAPIGYGNRINMMFDQTIDDTIIKNELSAIGYLGTEMTYVSGLKYYNIQLGAEIGMSINAIIEQLGKLQGIIDIEPDLVANNTF